MAQIKIDKKLNGKSLSKSPIKWNGSKVHGIADIVKSGLFRGSKNSDVSPWNFIYAYILFFFAFGLLVMSVAKLQIVQGSEMAERSESNKVRITKVPAERGVIFDADGIKLVENIASMNLYLSVEAYLGSDGEVDNQRLENAMNTLGGILGDNWKNISDGVEYKSLSDKVYSMYMASPYFSKILLASDIDNDTAINIKARSQEIPGITIDNGNKRKYIYNEYFTHILGYTGEASEKDVEILENVSSGDTVGKTGVERYYNTGFAGESGKLAEEVDAFGKTVSSEPYTLESPEPGQNLYLTIKRDMQIKMFDLLREAVEKNGAAGGAGIVQDVRSGEILTIVSYPSFDGNLFVGGISQKDFENILNNKQNPLMNRAIAAQMPPGSTFKTIIATAGLDAKVITKNTIYVSRSGYTFSNGAPFREYRGSSYGPLNIVDALTVSSNIFFCEMVRDWDMNKLVPYLEKFGIGAYTNIDIPGEAPGRLPSPDNKIKLANTTSPWLEPIWYPEGDSCNSVIGQGITLVTPIQMSNWMAAIANGGTLYTPHVAKKFVDADGFEYPVKFEILQENIASKESLDIVKKGMWQTVNSSRGIVGSLSNTGTQVAAKTGTAEFGKVNEKGVYEDTHAWVAGFFPFDTPKYSFTVFLEDGGSSSNASAVMREMITWMVQNGLVE
jgi:penicillin-binding protein 2